MGDEVACEHCSKVVPIETATLMGDYWYCPECLSEWQATFDACEHTFEPYWYAGEDGQLCSKCSGFVVNPSKPEADHG